MQSRAHTVGGISSLGMTSSDKLISAYLVLLIALVARALYYAEPVATSNPMSTCKKGGFLGLSCSAGCVKVKGKCIRTTSGKSASPPAPVPSTPSGHSLMRRRSVQNCLAAADAFESNALSQDGKAAAEYYLLAADAMNCALRMRGNGNILLLEGTSDTPENKRFWGQYGPRALTLVRTALSLDSSLKSDARARLIELDSFMCT